jgi:hypothetical protein
VNYAIPSHVYVKAVGDEAVLLDTRSDAFFGLNPSAAVVWDALATGLTSTDALDALVARFAVAPETARADVDALIDQLVAHGFLERRRE